MINSLGNLPISISLNFLGHIDLLAVSDLKVLQLCIWHHKFKNKETKNPKLQMLLVEYQLKLKLFICVPSKAF